MKRFHIQAKTYSGQIVKDEMRDGLKHKDAAIREAIEILDICGGFIRVQTIGAKGWMRFSVDPFSGQACQNQQIEWDNK